eukprot:TRINITY_DN5470_c0_g1_i1.p1 TRINITY_DN5470_c0_g1~~TRINITY_DN5470_c0_g1_i1.p1  ORF type:complete len:399 (+),score=122.53 TRINITY_DN5470_c0_g1_i1:70-1266(+)
MTEVREHVREIENPLRSGVAPLSAPRKPVRVWADGCFDMMHFGHANALRQAKALGDVLVVGVHSDLEILHHKGPVVMNEKERYAAVRACKWVDEVVEDAPYVTQLDWLEKYNIDFVIHGEDTSTDAEGRDSYAAVKAAGKFKYIKRTESVSTTSLVERLLQSPQVEESGIHPEDHLQVKSFHERSPYTALMNYIPTTRMITLFSDGRRPEPGQKVVYIDGAFDLFHLGHIEALRQCKQLGDFVIVGIYEEEVVRRLNGAKSYSIPLQTLHERVLTVLQCRYVDEVVIGAPFAVTEQLISALNISYVVHGQHTVDPLKTLPETLDPYKIAKDRGMYRELQSLTEPTTSVIIERVLAQRRLYEERNARKQAKEIKIIQDQEELRKLQDEQARAAAAQKSV